MAFESKILSLVAPVTTDAEFTCGTLFVTCTPREAARIQTILENPAYGVIVSPVGDQFAFDFV
jgi:hypothetical protein